MVSWERQLWTVLCNLLGVRAVQLSVVDQSTTDISETSCDTCFDNHCECWFWKWYRIPNRAAHDFHDWHSRLVNSNKQLHFSQYRYHPLASCSWRCCGSACLALRSSGREYCCYLITRTVGALFGNLTGEYLSSATPTLHLLLSIIKDTPLRLRVSGVRFNSTLKLPAGQ